MKFMIWQILAVIFLAGALTACGGDDDKGDNNNTPVNASPLPDGSGIAYTEADLNATATAEYFRGDYIENPTPPAGELGDFVPNEFVPSEFTMPREVIANGNLTILTWNAVQNGDEVYIMLEVRNDSTSIIGSMQAVVAFLDANNIRIDEGNIISASWNIQPGEIIVMSKSFIAPENYDGVYMRVIPNTDLFQNFKPFTNIPTTVEFDRATGELRGTALNTSNTNLVQPVIQFLLYDATGQLLDVIQPSLAQEVSRSVDAQATVTYQLTPIAGLDPRGNWLPGTMIRVQAQTFRIPSNNFALVDRVELRVIGYLPSELITTPIPTITPSIDED